MNTTEAMEKVNNWKAVLLDQATLNLQVYNNKIYFGGTPHSPQVCKEATGYGQLVSLASLTLQTLWLDQHKLISG